jgi:branched-chain amino acid transport system substrate-binding protein
MVGCGGAPAAPAKPAAPTAPAKPAEKVFKIGGIAGLQTGFGQSMKKAADLAIEEINAAGGAAGFKLTSEWFDTEGSAATGRTVAQRLITSGADVIIGCHASTVVLAIQDLMSQYKVLEIAMGSAEKIGELNNPWVVRVRESDTLTAKILTNYILDEAKLKKIAIIHMTDQYGTGGKDNMVTALKAKGITPATIQAHNAGDKDFSAQMLAMKRAGAQAMVIFSGATDNGIILKQAKQLIPEIKIFQSSVGATKPVMDVAGAAANGTYAVVTYTQDNPDAKVQKFVTAFKKKYNSDPPDFFAPLTYDSVYMVAEALKKANTNDHEKFRDAFRALKNFAGSSGLSYSVAPNGETVSELLLVQMKDGKHTVVSRVKL